MAPFADLARFEKDPELSHVGDLLVREPPLLPVLPPTVHPHAESESIGGPVRGRALLVDHVLAGFGGRTAAQAIEDGVEPRDVWRALCSDFDVPRDQW